MTTIGILGAGQLGWMLALAGYPLGFRFHFLDPVPGSPASCLAPQKVADFADQAALAYFARGVDLVTYEFENVPVESARFLERRVPVYPPPPALEKSQDRLVEKDFFRSLGIPTVAYRAVQSLEDLRAGVEEIGLPAVLKTRRMGYDGKGQAMIADEAMIDPAWEALKGTPLILEAFAGFRRELSVLAVRSASGQRVFYPLVENHHREGILRLSLAPVPDLEADLQKTAEMYAARVMEALDYVGVLAIELFQTDDGLLANEMAPRVHNSGHWTIEGAVTSQFENHLRAIAGYPLGAVAVNGFCAMINLIGSVPEVPDLLSIPGAHLYWYHKSARPNRKLGHLTLVAPDPERLNAMLRQVGEKLLLHQNDGGWGAWAKELLLHE